MSSKAAPAPDWAEARERSNWLAVRVMAWIALNGGRRIARLVLLPVTLYFLLFAPRARRHSVRFLTRALGRAPTWRERWRHFHTFASTVLDRVYFVRDRMDLFDLQLSGGELVDEVLAEGRGAFLLGAHVGSFEALHAVGAGRPGLRVAMVMYPDNARLIHGVLKAIAPQFELGIIPIGRSGSTLQIRDWLDGGGLAGLLGDRFVEGVGGARNTAVMLPFLGRPAPFADGPLRLALLLKRPVIFMVGLYRGGRRYDVRFEMLADFRQPPTDPAARERAVQDALQAYVRRLEELVHEAPDNWFNFHDFWHED